MKLAPVALLLTLSATGLAQAPFQPPESSVPFTDPANLRGERVAPLNGHELPIDQGALGLQQLLRKLNTRASLMLIVAHPDDEDGGMLTLYSRGLGARVADLALNRGEGGQNAMTGDFEDALGLIRTQELLSADRYFDASQMFGTEVDFGFSKTKEEAFAKWGHQRVLYDVVRAIRLYRPLVIASVFIGGVTDGHGQHQVAGEIAQEAFVAAADPNVFPELTAEGILPWAPLKVYARVPRQAVTAQGLFDYATNQYTPARFTNYVTGAVTTTLPSTDVVIHEGTTDQLLTLAGASPADLRIANLTAASPSLATGNSKLAPDSTRRITAPLSYVQFARIGLGLQRSQIGPGMRLPPPGAFDIGYHLYGSRLCNAPADARPTNDTNSADNTHEADNTHDADSTHNANSAVILSGAKDLCISPAAALPSSAPTSNLSSRPERSAVERPAAPSAAALPPDPSTPNPQPASFFTGIDTSVDGIADLAPHLPLSFRAAIHDLSQSIARSTSIFEAKHSPQSQDNQVGRDSVALSLADALKQADALISGIQTTALPATEKANVLHELRIKRVQLNDALALASGLAIDASSPDINVTPRWGKWFDATITTRPNSGCTLERSWLENAAGAESEERAKPQANRPPSTADRIELTLVAGSAKTPDDTDFTNILTRPYFERQNIEQPFYDLRDASLRNAPQSPPAFTAHAELKCSLAAVHVSRIVHTEYGDRQPVIVLSPLNIQLSSHAQVLLPGAHRIALKVTDDSFGSLAFLTGLCLPTGCVMPHYTPVDPSGRTRIYHLDIPHQLQQSPFTITARGQSGPPRPLPSMTSSAVSTQAPQVTHTAPMTSPGSLAPEGIVNAEGIRMVGYPGLIPTPYYTPATTRIVPVDLKLPPENHHRIAYLPGTGDAVPEALASIGLAPTILTVADLTPDKLKAYDTIILGVRTYNAHPDLHGAPTQALLDYAGNGGNVLVQYQTYEFTAADAPFPLTLGNAEKVVDETAPVKLIDPSDPLLSTPNKITSADFNAWNEERGHGFLHTWDPRYAALTETHDPGQAPQLGGLITTALGKGRWTYCAFALYRQLPEAVPGAYRLFVNLLNP